MPRPLRRLLLPLPPPGILPGGGGSLSFPLARGPRSTIAMVSAPGCDFPLGKSALRRVVPIPEDLSLEGSRGGDASSGSGCPAPAVVDNELGVSAGKSRASSIPGPWSHRWRNVTTAAVSCLASFEDWSGGVVPGWNAAQENRNASRARTGSSSSRVLAMILDISEGWKRSLTF